MVVWTEIIFTGLPNLQKEMDNILLESENYDTMSTVMRSCLERCGLNVVVLSRPRIDCSQSVLYAEGEGPAFKHNWDR